jgi:hypothetical protein
MSAFTAGVFAGIVAWQVLDIVLAALLYGTRTRINGWTIATSVIFALLGCIGYLLVGGGL